MENKKSKFSEFFRSHRARKGTYAIIITAVFTAIVVLVNILTGIAVEKYPALQFDMTQTQTYQLQDDTVQYLKQVDKDVTIYVLEKEKNLIAGNEYIYQADKLLRKIGAENDHITLKFIDLTKNPTFKSKYKNADWSATGQDQVFIIVDAGDEKYRGLSFGDCFTFNQNDDGSYVFASTTVEQAVVTGLLSTTSNELVGVDFLLGSGESEEYYSGLEELLKQNAYEINEVDITTGKLSKDSDIAVLYAPVVDLSKDSVKKLEKWLDSESERGKTLIYIPYSDAVETPNLDTLLEKYGMKVTQGAAFCLNPNYVYNNNEFIFKTDYANDTYTETLRDPSITVATLNARPVEITDTTAATPLLSVSDNVGVLPFDVAEVDSYDKYMVSEGINIAAIGTKKGADTSNAHIAVFGSPLMLAASTLADGTVNNANYIVNFCNTITERGDLGIIITSAQSDKRVLSDVTDSTVNTINAIFVWILPIIILLIGLAVSIYRKRRSTAQGRGYKE